MKGLFIVFEGPDGSGLSTQSNLLAKWFESKKKKVLLTKEPTNNMIGGIIRGILRKEWKVDMKTLALLFSADRAHHLESEIEPALKKGYNVICDRYVLSTLAFEGTGAKIEWLKQLNSQFRTPDFTFIMDVPGRICVERIKKSRFGIEFFEEPEKLDRIRENYKELKDYFPNTFIIKGDTKPPDEINQKIIEIIQKQKV
ncbi:MAG: dTMP kinase [Candidatus Aenigmarchaeota archaeon]|nr:dTMP kinase [Candidatus Aenigmarchaeota archaeon]